MKIFSDPFKQSPIPTFIRNDQAVKVLTSSVEFEQKVMRVDCVSGSSIFPIKRGMIVYRYDGKDEAKGTPINVDIYSLEGSILSKISPPFPGHRLASLPT